MKTICSIMAIVFSGILTLRYAIAQPQWSGVEKDKLKAGGIIMVENAGERGKGMRTSNRLARGMKKFPNGAVILESLGVNPYSETDKLQIGKNESILIEFWPAEPVIVTFIYQTKVLEATLAAGLPQAKEILRKEVTSWTIPSSLKRDLIKQIEAVATKDELGPLLKKGVRLTIKSWAEYKIGDAFPDAKVRFGKNINDEHVITMDIVTIEGDSKDAKVTESIKSPLFGQEKSDGKAVQLWGGKWPVQTRMQLDKDGKFTWSIMDKKKGVELQITMVSSASYSEQEQGEDGQWRWGPPSKRIEFSDDMGKQHTIQAKVGDKTISCPLRYQDVAYFIEKGKRAGRVGVSWYAGCPFEITKPLDVTSNLEMRLENTIEIEDAQDNILFVSPTSVRPIVFQGGQVFTGCETFRNMVWVFKKSGIEFRAKDDTYVVKKAGATIKFSPKGMEMEGIEKEK